ncbi:FG-GAP repeat domain-containing protein [Agromyces marinus]|uniref:Repeat domain-containing protein n=1 Tax=Agromyces marinus TaxID=1389020 RepID=A0ABN6YIF9_9MICO|nr:VCBS repeat-containing protein [Agromyces marinus]UIP59688.1 hypothetical protein DSM26151_26020 [Agromyces marinus]BDZ55238.1 hypothetical protein GCM10025870_23110 [Agromyces marinus]
MSKTIAILTISSLLTALGMAGSVVPAQAAPAQGAAGMDRGGTKGKPPSPPAAGRLTTPAYALPGWGDGQWSEPADWGTIQTADLDGDGSAELLGRSSLGLEAWDFDLDAGQWHPMVVAGGLGWTDENGWDLKRRYETIGAADLDRDGRDEVYARAESGIVVAELGGNGRSWIGVDAVDQPFADDDPLDTAAFYPVIQPGDVDGDGSAELIGFGLTGLVTASFEGDEWQVVETGAFAADEWREPEHYLTIHTGDLDRDGRDEVFARGANGLEVWGLESGGWIRQGRAGLFAGDQWSEPSRYLTIGTADIDGDGDVEVYGRDSGGIRVLDFTDPGGAEDAGEWADIGTISAFSDAAGWDAAYRYATIHAADVDGDGRDEFLGRDSTGMTVWGTTPSASTTWTSEQRVDGPAFTDALGWRHARYYGTIQAADVDGFAPIGSPGSAKAGRAELIGRGPTGIQTYRFDAKAGAWVSPSVQFPAFTGGALKAYSSMSRTITCPAADSAYCTDDIRSHYDVDASDYLEPWMSDLEKLPPAKGVSKKTWDAVRTQVVTELGWAIWVKKAMNAQSALVGDIGQARNENSTFAYLHYEKPNDTPPNVISSVVSALAGTVVAVANAADPEWQILAGGIDVAVSFAGSLGSSTNASGTYDEMFGAGTPTYVSNWTQQAQAGLVSGVTTVVTDYGLLATVGGLYADEEWVILDSTAPGWHQSVVAADRAYSVFLWQALTPTLTVGCESPEACTGWGVYGLDDDKSGYPYTIGDFAYLPSVLPAGDSLESRWKQLFRDVDTDCAQTNWDPTTCGYGVDPDDFFLGLGGWALPCVDFVAGACLALESEAATYGTRSIDGLLAG